MRPITIEEAEARNKLITNEASDLDILRVNDLIVKHYKEIKRGMFLIPYAFILIDSTVDQMNKAFKGKFSFTDYRPHGHFSIKKLRI